MRPSRGTIAGRDEGRDAMISFFRGPGGFWRRLLSEGVPLWIATLAAGTSTAVLPPRMALLVWALAWIGLSTLLHWVRSRDRLRRIYRIAFGLHVAFWTTLGALHSYPHAPGVLGAPTVADWGRATTFEVGVGSARFELPDRATLAGWGQVPRRIRVPPFGGFGVLGRLGQDWMGATDARGAPRRPLFRRADNVATHDLGARAMVIVPEGIEGAATVAFLRLDVVTIERALVDEILERLAPLGIGPETLTVSATHTHSGPGGYSRQPLSEVVGTDHFDPEVFRAIASAAVTAVEAAVEGRRQGLLWYGTGLDRDAESGAPILARNRRRADGDEIDDRVHVLGLGFRASGRVETGPGGLLVNYAVHPILNRRRTTSLSRDLAGDLERALSSPASRRLLRQPESAAYEPWEALFVNGAAADVSPRHGTSASAAPEARGTNLAELFARQALPRDDAWEASAISRVRIRAARVARDYGTPHAIFGAGDRPALIEAAEDGLFSGGLGGILADLVALPVNAVIWSSGITEARVAFRFSGSAGVIANLELAVTQNEHACGAIGLDVEESAGVDGPRDVAILWAPAEATQALGRHWRATIADGFLFGYTNGVMAYVTTDAEYERESYESRTTLYGRRTGTMVGEALRAAFEAAINSGAGP